MKDNTYQDDNNEEKKNKLWKLYPTKHEQQTAVLMVRMRGYE